MNKQGYILFMTMAMLALGTAVVTQIFYLGNLYNSYIALTLERDRARQLALSGTEIAMAQLMTQDNTLVPAEDKAKEDKDKKPDPEKERAKHKKNMLKILLSVQQQWQKFVLTYEHDGIDAELNICIVCEDGKLNLNALYDFKNGKFTPAMGEKKPEALLTMLTEKAAPLLQQKNIMKPLSDFLHKQKRPLLTVTELLKKDEIGTLFKDRIFYEPAQVTTEEDQEKQPKPTLYLEDIFTVEGQSTMNPWLLSASIKTLLGFDSSKKFSAEQIADIVKKVELEEMQWETDWDTYLKPVYGKEYKALPKEVVPFLSSKFEPQQFSVVCYAKVGRVGQKLLAILEKSAVKQGEVIKVKKLYWL